MSLNENGLKIDKFFYSIDNLSYVTPEDAMPNVLEGEAEFTIGDKSYRVKAGESIVMPIGIPHSVNFHSADFCCLLSIFL